MTLQQIRYVAEIARHGTISKAAQELYITQPHLSSVLKELENELGITIFSRARKVFSFRSRAKGENSPKISCLSVYRRAMFWAM